MRPPLVYRILNAIRRWLEPEAHYSRVEAMRALWRRPVIRPKQSRPVISMNLRVVRGQRQRRHVA